MDSLIPPGTKNAGHVRAAFEIRAAYYNDIINKMDVGSFAYFENQYVGDHEFAKKLFTACEPMVTRSWCRPDAFAHFVIPYVPGGPGITKLINHAGWTGIGDIDRDRVIPGILKDEAKNLLWLEIKTTKGLVRDRNTGNYFRFLQDPPVPTSCIPQKSDIHFVDSNVDADPVSLTLDSEVSILGSDPTLPCPSFPGLFIQVGPVIKKVRDIIVDSGIMSFVLVTTPHGGPSNAVSYNEYLQKYDIYVHSKHSEFWHNAGDRVPTTYVMGSANLNTRSLGKPQGYNQDDFLDSEDAIFWEPNDQDQFYRELWKEHTGNDYVGKPTDLGTMIQEWRNEAWDNYDELHRSPGSPKLKGRVVRLDVVERCLNANAGGNSCM